MIKHNINILCQRLINTHRRSLSKLITIIENKKYDNIQNIIHIINYIFPYTQHSIRIGISGMQGVGKSTFINAFGSLLIKKKKTIGILTIDPSSPISGGSILADKTIMTKVYTHNNAYIRSIPSYNNVEGISNSTYNTILLMEAYGCEIILIETLGIGQSEHDVCHISDIFIILLKSMSTYTLQNIKKGTIELANIILLNKNYMNNNINFEMKQISHTTDKTNIYNINALYNKGITKIWNIITQQINTNKDNHSFYNKRYKQIKTLFITNIKNILLKSLYYDPYIKKNIKNICHILSHDKYSIDNYVLQLLNKILN